MDNVIVIGICGGSASGKSRLSRELFEAFSDHATLILQDDYYQDSSGLTKMEQAQKNYDHPSAIELDRLAKDVSRLKQGLSIEKPIYCFESHSRKPQTEIIRSTKLVFIEGIFVFELPALRSLIDLKVFLSVDDDIRLIRRITRDVLERGRTLDSVISQYISTVKPMHDQFVAPAKEHADIVVASVKDSDISNAISEINAKINELAPNL